MLYRCAILRYRMTLGTAHYDYDFPVALIKFNLDTMETGGGIFGGSTADIGKTVLVAMTPTIWRRRPAPTRPNLEEFIENLGPMEAREVISKAYVLLVEDRLPRGSFGQANNRGGS